MYLQQNSTRQSKKIYSQSFLNYLNKNKKETAVKNNSYKDTITKYKHQVKAKQKENYKSISLMNIGSKNIQ